MGAFRSRLALPFAEVTSGLDRRQISIVKVAGESPVPILPVDPVLRGGIVRSEDVSASDFGGFFGDSFFNRNGAGLEPTRSTPRTSPSEMGAFWD